MLLSTIHYREVIKKSYLKGLLYVFALSVSYCGYLYVSLTEAPIIVNLIGSILAGFTLSQMIGVGHDAIHGCLVPSRLLNKALSYILMFFPMHSPKQWKLSHNVKHHHYTQLRHKESGWSPLSYDDYMRLSAFNQFIYRVYRHPIGVALYYFNIVFIRNSTFPWEKDQRQCNSKLDNAYVAFSIMAQPLIAIGLASYLDPGKGVFAALLLGWIIPQAANNLLIGAATYLHHTHPSIPWYQDNEKIGYVERQIKSTPRIMFPWYVHFWFLNIMEHTAHHLMPTVPIYNLKKAQRYLEKVSPIPVQVLHINLVKYLDITRRCKLYDYEHKCWMDFDGNPTSERHKLDEPSKKLSTKKIKLTH